MLLKIVNLDVSIRDKILLKRINLEVERGEIHVIFGPNGAGKSTLLKTIIGLPPYKIVSGRILFNGEDITNLKPYEKALRGIALAYQNPPPLDVKTRYLIKKMKEKYGIKDVPEIIPAYLYDRNIFSGFSGGERKKTELGLVMLQNPKVALLDEPDSGVDVDGIKDVAKIINNLREKGCGIVLVTHQGFITKHLDDINKAHIMVDGRIVFSGDFLDVYKMILTKGYKEILKGEK
ncbi:MAG: ABC transporter ATP-binding protein [Thermoprotei archaeon]|nr:MAG: ABC transporter [Thermofilum sp. ex4484_79]RLF08710.1 MAG: ABC transporter ATP-binding protein [Thermoprotei archaeon]